MPQFDVHAFPSEIFWLLLVFGLLYALVQRLGLRRLLPVLLERRECIEQNLDEADALQSQVRALMHDVHENADQKNQEALEVALRARREAREHHRKALQSLEEEHQKRMTVFEEELLRDLRQIAPDELIVPVVSRVLDCLWTSDGVLQKTKEEITGKAAVFLRERMQEEKSI